MGLARLLPGERRAMTALQAWSADLPWGNTTTSGLSVTQTNVLALTAVYDAVRVISDPICTMPIDPLNRVNGERVPLDPYPAWVDRPDPDPSVQRSDHYQQLMVSMLLNGNYFGRILRDPASGDVLAVAALDPTKVEPRRNRDGRIEFEIRIANGGIVRAENMIHITELRKPGALRGTSRIDEMRETFGIGKALDEYVARYFSGSHPPGLILVPGDMGEEQAKGLKDDFEKNSRGLRNAHRPNVLTGGADYKQLMPTAEQSQLTEARDFFVLEVSRAFKIPPSKLGVNTEGTRAYASVEQDNIDFATTTLQFYVAKIEEAYSRLLWPSTAFLRFNMASLVRGDISTRYTAYSQGLDAGWLTGADVRRWEDLSPIEGSEVLRVPLENMAIGAADIVETEKRVSMFSTLVSSGVVPADAARVAGLPSMNHTGLPSVQLQAPADTTPLEDE